MQNKEEIPIRVWLYKRRKRKRVKFLIFLVLIIILFAWALNYLSNKHEELKRSIGPTALLSDKLLCKQKLAENVNGNA